MLGPSFCNPEEEREFWGCPCTRLVRSDKSSLIGFHGIQSSRLSLLSVTIELKYLFEEVSLNHLETAVVKIVEGLTATLPKTFPSAVIKSVKELTLSVGDGDE